MFTACAIFPIYFIAVGKYVVPAATAAGVVVVVVIVVNVDFLLPGSSKFK